MHLIGRADFWCCSALSSCFRPSLVCSTTCHATPQEEGEERSDKEKGGWGGKGGKKGGAETHRVHSETQAETSRLVKDVGKQVLMST